MLDVDIFWGLYRLRRAPGHNPHDARGDICLDAEEPERDLCRVHDDRELLWRSESRWVGSDNGDPARDSADTGNT